MNIPEEFKKIAESAELYDQSEAIGNKFGLHIDQIGELDAEIRDILSGTTDSKDFNRDLVERMEITPKLADQIVQEVNTSLFEALRRNLQSQTSQQPSPISSLERVGGFSIDKPATEPERKPVTPADRNSILAGLENPPTSAPTPTDQVPANLPTSSTNSSNPVPRTLPAQPKQEESHVEPLVDYLLSNPVGQASKTISPTRPTPAQQPKPRPAGTPDPYRESF